LAKIRINKLALELKVQNDQIIDELLKREVPVKNYMSLIDEDMAEEIRNHFSKGSLAKKDGKDAGSKAKAVPKKDGGKDIGGKAKIAPKTKAKTAEEAPPAAPVETPAPAKTTARAKKAPSVESAKAKKTAKPEEKTKPEKLKIPEKKEGKVIINVETSGAPLTDIPSAPDIEIEGEGEEFEAKFGKVDRSKPIATKFPKKEVVLVKKREREDEIRVVKKLGLKVVKQEDKSEERPKIAAKAAAEKPVAAVRPVIERPAAAKPMADKPAPAIEPTAVAVAVEEVFEKIQLTDNIPVRDLAEKLKCSPNDIIRELMNFGVLATINKSLDVEIASKVADKLGFEVEIVAPETDADLEKEEEDLPADRIPRPPIVTIMGHVDHGKTSLLDAIRQTKLVDLEKGGITQHIGAYQVKIKEKFITFLDTPGHEAFTAMRARGAQVTDIVVLVVAADDGIKPQTQEAIDHAMAAGVPIIVAINKIDKPDAKPDEVKKQLSVLGLMPEEWGGQTIFALVSALKKTGIDHLLELILLQAEVMEMKANPKVRAQGVVIESKLDKGRGPVATVIVRKGALRVGDPIIIGAYFGKVRALITEHGKKKPVAYPSDPVEIVGLPEVSKPGDKFFVVGDERKARQSSQLMVQKIRERTLAQSTRITMEDLHRQIAEGKLRDLHLILKADTQGSVLALREAFSKLDNVEVRIKVIHGGVGGITESDVLLSTASNAIIIGFNVRPTDQASTLAERERVDVRLYGIIYDAVNDMKKALDGMLTPKYRERVTGRAVVQQVFTIPKAGQIAGCKVVSGVVERSASARLVRDNIVIYQGKINSLRRFKEDVKEVQSGYECGLSFDKHQDIKQDDVVEPFVMEEIKV
jgi:translation initiation factor IF-2